MSHPVNHNNIKLKGKATSYSNALSLARGMTSPIFFFDEPEFTDHIKTIVENSASTFSTAAEKSQKNGTMYFRCFTCTPGDLDTQPGMESQELLEKTVKWTEQMYNWSPEKRQEYINANDSNLIVYIEYDYKQIGKTEEWFEKEAKRIGNPLTVRRELLLQRLKGSNTSPYPREEIDAIIELEHKRISEFFLLEYYRVDVYTELKKDIPYLVGIDCSTGSGGDNNAIEIINPYTLEVDAEFESSFIGETMFEALIKELVLKHIPKAVLCIERNSVGDAVIDHLLYSPIAGNLYFDRNKDLMQENIKESTDNESMLKKQAKLKTFYGVYTEGNSRGTMFEILANHVYTMKEKFVGHNVIRDISRLVRTAGGRIEAGKGFHDDSVMAYLMALYVYYHGNNLPLFGVYPGMKDQGELNEGMYKPTWETVDEYELPDSVREMVKEEKKKAENKDDYYDMLRRAQLANQRRDIKMAHSTINVSNTFTRTPEYMIEDIEPGNQGSIPLSLFDQLNGF